jgi:uncharacterized protein YgiM (DUF1202 family)
MFFFRPLSILFTISLLASLKSQALCVITEKANLRAGPGPNFKLTWTVPKYTPLLEVDKKGSWYEVEDQDGEKHWVYASNVSKKIQCVAVQVGSANLRRGPGPEHGVGDIWKVDKYTPFQRVDISDNGWYQVEAPWGGQYWLSPSLVWRPVRVRGISY